MAKLNKKERAWLDELQEVLNRCPSKRLGFATSGDCDVTVYDSSFDDLIFKILDHEGGDFIPVATKLGAVLGGIVFPANVESTAG